MKTFIVFVIICFFSILSIVQAEELSPIFDVQKIDPQKFLEVCPEADPDVVDCVYKCYTANFPPNSQYSFYIKKLGQEHFKVCNCFANSAGQLIRFDNDKTQPLSQFLLFLNDFMPGEPIEYFVVSVNDQDVRAVKVIPNPLEQIGRDGRKLSLELLSPDKMLFAMHLTHFHPNEAIISQSQTGDEMLTNRLTVSEEGRLRGVIQLVEDGQKAGTSCLTVTPEESDYPLEIVYEWGA